MGQPVAVTEKPSSTPGIVRFELNRNLTGQGHERFTNAADAKGPGPAAELARRLFATGQVDRVHAYLNVVTVDLRKGYTADGLKPLVENLYIYYRPGVLPPSDEELMGAVADAPAAAAPAAAADGGAAPAVDSRVPAHLLERSRLARERWAAKQAG